MTSTSPSATPRRSSIRAALLTAALAAAACSSSPGSGKVDSMPAKQLAAGTDYRFAHAGLTKDVVLAARAIDASGNGTLELLKVGSDKPLVLSTRAEPESVKVALAAPGRALFLESPNNDAIGTLKLADLDAATATTTNVPSGAGVATDGFRFGKTGGEILFVGGYSATTRRGTLFWSNGTESKNLGADAAPGAVVLTDDRSRALVGVGLSASGVGKLLAVSLTDGAVTELSASANLLSAGGRPTYSLSADGAKVAFANAAGKISVVPTAGGAAVEIADGEAPSLSADGSLVAYFAGTDVFTSAVPGTPVSIGTFAGRGETHALVSADKKWVVYFNGAVNRGGGLVGEAWVASATKASDAVKLGANVGESTVSFARDGSRVTGVADLVDLAHQATYEGIGNLVVLALPATAPAKKVSSGIVPFDVAPFAKTDSLGYIADVAQGIGVGKTYVIAADGTPVAVGSQAIPKSLRAATAADGIMFLAEREIGPVDADYEATGTLYSSTDGKTAKKLQAKVLRASFTPQGRALVVVPAGEQAGVWTIPVP